MTLATYTCNPFLWKSVDTKVIGPHLSLVENDVCRELRCYEGLLQIKSNRIDFSVGFTQCAIFLELLVSSFSFTLVKEKLSLQMALLCAIFSGSYLNRKGVTRLAGVTFWAVMCM